MTSSCRRGLGGRESRQETALKDPGNKVSSGPLTRKPRLVMPNVQTLVSIRFWDPCAQALQLIFSLEENTHLNILLSIGSIT
jgi:hypothetical protein